MTEKEFEQLLIKHPELIEEGLRFHGSQIYLDGKLLDLLYEDENGQKLIVEVKIIARRKDIAQLMDYAGYFIEKEPKPIRAMLVALRIPINYRHSFDYWGFEYKEIPDYELLKVEPRIVGKEILQEPLYIAQGLISRNIKVKADALNKRELVSQDEKNLTRQNMATRIKAGKLFNQAKHAIDFLSKASGPISMKEFVTYMKSHNYKAKSFYDLFNALCDSGLVKSTMSNGHKTYLLAED